MAALAPGKYRVSLFASLGNENAGRFSRARFDSAIASAWSSANAAVELDGLTRNPNTTVANARNCGRIELRTVANITIKQGSNVEKIDLIRDVIRVVGLAGGIVRNAALESVWSTGRAAAADSACTADLTRGSFSVTRTGAAAPRTTTRPAGSRTPVNVSVAPSPPPEAPPVSVAERIASGGSTVADATDVALQGATQSALSFSAVADSVAVGVGVPRWVANVGLGVLLFGLGGGLLLVIAGASGVIAEKTRK